LHWLASSFPSFFCQLTRPQEHGVEHGFGKNAGEGVLLGGMVAAEEGEARGRFVFGAVGEPGFRFDSVETKRGIPRESAEADNASRGGEQLEFATGVGEAGVAFGGGRFVLGWSTADGGRDPEPAQAQTVAGTL
jgi:hypothetical protein